MAIFVATMIGIVITAGGVLGAVYLMHVIAGSPRLRARFRRRAFALVAGLYGIRRQLGYRLQRAAAATIHGLRPVVLRVVHRVKAWAAAHEQAVLERTAGRAPSVRTGPADARDSDEDSDHRGALVRVVPVQR